MRENSNNLSQDKKIDKLQFQMDSVLKSLERVDENQKETNNRLEAMQKGFVGREEYKEFQTFVGKLASQKDLDATNGQVEDLEDWNKWAIRIVLGAVLLAAVGGLLATGNI